jgi:hypothetical protein
MVEKLFDLWFHFMLQKSILEQLQMQVFDLENKMLQTFTQREFADTCKDLNLLPVSPTTKNHLKACLVKRVFS